MQQLLKEIQDVLEQDESDLTLLLKKGKSIWKAAYPIALLHSKTRLQDPSQITLLQEQDLLDEQGLTPTHYPEGQLSRLSSQLPFLCQSIAFAAFKKGPPQTLVFAAKRKNDYWKKAQELGYMEASFDYITCVDNDPCQVEFELRELIRKRKEVHALKEVGFIWMAICEHDISTVFEHYFGNNYMQVKGKYHIGWSPELKQVNMRYFFCPPK